MNLFSMNNIVGRFMNWIANLIILNFLWLICSLPIVTIGASTTALYYSTMKWLRRDEGYIYKNFFKSFKENFKQSTIIWIILLIIGVVLGMDLRIGIFFNNENAGDIIGKLMIISSIVLLIPYSFVLLYIFPVQAKFENTVINNCKNALLMAVAHLHYSLLLYFFAASFVLMTLISKAFIGIEILCGAGLYAWLTSNIYVAAFRKHLPDELEDDAEASGINLIN